ncbi:hypothetical protein FJSC11DRAFT_2437 [Fischerella thermalis JSC-11]|uniref:Uncharacterized protein n=1 Tax=Fischerella thermalis JSC-11 TaxID=741277 RepID=G6FU90_9CYAN|nr:hypothetical protein FJSC11DRAFT_2437 [Fischerella thermalis JSC-11]
MFRLRINSLANSISPFQRTQILFESDLSDFSYEPLKFISWRAEKLVQDIRSERTPMHTDAHR